MIERNEGMAVAKWSGVLSTTEPRNDIGIIKVRQGNVNSEIAEFQIIQNNKPYDLTGLTVYFCASFGLNLVEKPAVVVNTVGGKIQYTFDEDSMQAIGRQKGYFSIKKEENKIDSTQEFEYQVESNLMNRSIDGKSYIYKLSTLIKILEDFVKNGQNNFNTWFDSVKEILYGVDPGGNILRELIEARQDASGKIFSSLKDRLNGVDLKMIETVETVNANLEITNKKFDKTIKSFREFTVNISDFGAVYDDPNFNNMPIISLAQDYVEANGGGDIYFPDKGILYVKPFLRLKDGIRLIGSVNRPVIKIAPDVKDFFMLFGIEYVNNVSIISLEIDENKEGRTGYDISVQPQIILSLSQCNDIFIENNTLKGCGVWMVACFTGGQATYGSRINVLNNHFIWKAGLSSRKAGLPGDVDVDNTILYFDAIGYVVKNNLFETEDGTKNMTCIEAHGADAHVSENTIRGFRQAIIVWSLVVLPDAKTKVYDNNIWVEKNTFEDVEGGVWIGATPNFDLKGIYIQDNNMLLNPKKYKRKSARGIQVREPSAITTTRMSKIYLNRNSIEFMPDDTVYSDPETVFNFTGIEVSEGQIDMLEIKDNNIINVPGVGIFLQHSGAVKLHIKNGIVAGNKIFNTGKGSKVASSEYSGFYPILVKENANTILENVEFGTNYIFDDKIGGTYFKYPVTTTLSDMKEPIIKVKGISDWYKRKFTSKLMFDLQEGSFSTKQNNTFEMKGNNVLFKIDIEITSHNVTAGTGMHMELPLLADISEPFMGGHFRMIHPTQQREGTLLIPKGNKKYAYLQYPRIDVGDIPSTTRILGEFEYPIGNMAKYTITN